MQLSPQHYAAAWFNLLSQKPKKEWSVVSKKVLRALYQRGHLHWLPEIVNRVEELEAQATGDVPVTVTAPHALSQKEAHALAKEVLGTDPKTVTTIVDESLIGGIQVETKNNRWDLSVKSALTDLTKTLTA